MEIILISLAVIFLFIVTLAIISNIGSSATKKKAQKILKEIQEESKKRKTNYIQKPHNARVFEKNKQKEQEIFNEHLYEDGLITKLENKHEQEIQKDEGLIVGIAKPLGKWTEFVIRQTFGKIKTFANLYNASDDKKYWVNMVKAQNMWKGKGKGKGR